MSSRLISMAAHAIRALFPQSRCRSYCRRDRATDSTKRIEVKITKRLVVRILAVSDAKDDMLALRWQVESPGKPVPEREYLGEVLVAMLDRDAMMDEMQGRT